MIGVVLPVVLVILTVLTGLVVTQVRRGTTDERLAANARESVLLDGAVQTYLRICEDAVMRTPFNIVNVAGTTATPAWRIANNWTDANSLNVTGMTLVTGMSGDPTCIVEDATCELQPPISPTGMNSSGCNGIDSRWRKFRITARIRIDAPDLPGGFREMMSQSELRLYTN
jgi:Tfp pilus assembly protein PilX